jgi:hypothetical protein
MRLCPETALTSRGDKSLTLKYFDDACKLDGETQPSPTFKTGWYVYPINMTVLIHHGS